MMSDDEHFDIERELVAAMAQRAGGLPAPRVDLPAIRRRTATRRRIMVPAIATGLALVTAAPFAVAQSGLLDHGRSGGSGVGSPVSTSLPSSGSVLPGATAPNGSAVSPGPKQGGSGSQGSKGSPAPGAGSGDSGCASVRGPLTAAERSALLGEAQTVLAQARSSLAGALDKGGLGDAKPVAFSHDLPNQLLPEVGTVVSQVECEGQRHLSAAQHKATLDQVRRAVLSMGLVTIVVMDQTGGFLGISTGELSATARFERMTDDSLVMTGTISSGGLAAFQHTMTVTMRLPDFGVTKVDLRDLGLLGTSLSDLRRSLSAVSGGMQGVVPGILTTNATVLGLPTP